MSAKRQFRVTDVLVVMITVFILIAVARTDSRADAVIALIQREPVDAEDDVIRRGVKRALVDLDARGNAEIQVRVKDGVVWLSGSVPTWEGNSARLHAARSVTGVRSINNGVRVVAPAMETR